MGFCKWCKKYAEGMMFSFEFVCLTCIDTAFDYYTKRDEEVTWP